jgi:hypothetical protein
LLTTEGRLQLILLTTESRPEGLPNARYSPRRGESAKQRARDRGGIRVLGMISGKVGSRFIRSNYHESDYMSC